SRGTSRSTPEMPAGLDEVFDRLVTILGRYAPPLVVRSGGVAGKRDFQLWSEKDVTIDGGRRKEIYFAGAIVQRGYIGFYFMPVHTHAEQTALFASELLGLLKGKSCFHLKHLDVELAVHVEDALARGFELYRDRGWVE
ncbi:MAG TPA: hypothetical protein VFU34_02555, partial [Gaiellaceae bacterium]|nr:hypothetical protein [Gaiellaceae bacterium]